MTVYSVPGLKYCWTETIDGRFIREYITEAGVILDEAKALVYGSREKEYSHPMDDFQRVGRLWAALLGLPEITPEQVALCLGALKMSRLVGNPGHHDSIVDWAGYAATYERVRERRSAELPLEAISTLIGNDRTLGGNGHADTV